MKRRSIFSDARFRAHLFSSLNAAVQADEDLLSGAERALLGRILLWMLQAKPEGDTTILELLDFCSFCHQNVRRSHSQIYQDLWVLYLLKEKRGGYFVEFGACDGEKLSNTLLLEKEYNWSGILAEPNPVWHSKLVGTRNCQIDFRCVADRTGAEITFHHIPTMPELSRMKHIVPQDIHERNGNRSVFEQFVVGTVSLNDLLVEHNAPQHIDYISIDTEGSELSILQGFDFSSYYVQLFSVEHAGEASKREAVRALLEANGYSRWWPELSQWDDWYVRAV